ncbi:MULTISPECIES: diguanylate cyclase [unclassified Herbaspirillum]|uniref:diguanylate cyclase n=1 Tax=unclassified Herbaspirillum TaxID=2624150 RepID=UPI002105C356|nr:MULTISPECIES: diguanylate cyclase [unclassified Herbaspirillum]
MQNHTILPHTAPMHVALTQSVQEKPVLLVVDDQASNIQELYEIFKDDYEVCMATTGADAIAFCERQKPDLILLDIVMPEMDGYAVCQQLKNNPLTKAVPLIFVTARNDPEEEARGFDEGAVDFIRKPFHSHVVRARIRTHLTMKKQSDFLRSLSLTDGLTGVANRRQFDIAVKAEWRRCMRVERPLGLIMIDVDFFKSYNDFYGHQAGDNCLHAIATAIKTNCNRSHDVIARYGGEEFVCILPDTPLEGARQKAQQLEKLVRELGIAHEKSSIARVVTVSLGVAVAIPHKDDSVDDLIACADRQLFLAKRSGRGKVESTQIRHT